MAGLIQVTPFVRCASLAGARAFYCAVLGFESRFQAANNAYLKRDAVALRLIECPPDPDGRALGAEQSFYIDVEDVDALYEGMRAGLDALPSHRVRAPFDQAYGQREFHVLDEDGALVFFGAPVAAVPSG